MDNSSYSGEINLIKNEHDVRLLLNNARSLHPKTESLKDAFFSPGLNIACVSETWYKGGQELRDHLVDLESAAGIHVQSRDGRRKRLGG